MVDGDGFEMSVDLAADCRLDFQFAAGRQSEIDIVEHSAGDPPVVRYPRDSREPHAGCSADDIEDGRHSLYPANRVDIRFKTRQQCRSIFSGNATARTML
jgi:hypothetical protein